MTQRNDDPPTMDDFTPRDLFAGMAMMGDWAAQGSMGVWSDDAKDEYLLARAKLYYRMADAMIAARERT